MSTNIGTTVDIDDHDQVGPRYRCMPGWLSVRPLEQVEVTPGGLYVPKNAGTRREIVGTVVSVGAALVDGSGNKLELSLRPGDTVLYTRHAGTGFERSEEVVIMFLKFTDVIARIAPDKYVAEDALDKDIRGRAYGLSAI